MNNIDQIKLATNIEFFARQVVEGFITGKHKSPYHGFSVEFAEHKLYNTGESTRHIDWKLYARSDKLFIKRFEEETNLRCQLIVDTSSSMYYPNFSNISLENPNKILFSIYAWGRAFCSNNSLFYQVTIKIYCSSGIIITWYWKINSIRI